MPFDAITGINQTQFEATLVVTLNAILTKNFDEARTGLTTCIVMRRLGLPGTMSIAGRSLSYDNAIRELQNLLEDMENEDAARSGNNWLYIEFERAGADITNPKWVRCCGGR